MSLNVPKRLSRFQTLYVKKNLIIFKRIMRKVLEGVVSQDALRGPCRLRG